MNVVDVLPLLMFVAMAILLFSGYPVALVLGGLAVWFGFIGVAFDVFAPIQFFAIVGRIWGGAAENSLLIAIPMFILMGTILEKSGVAEDLLNCLQVLLRRVPGALAVAVIAMGTILAASTGIVGASVVMLSSLALPVMLQRGYTAELATGTIGASGTLGILIPPSIMLVVLADLMSLSATRLFAGAMLPGLLLAGLYTVYAVIHAMVRPQDAPPLGDEQTPPDAIALLKLVLRGLVPPTALITLVLGSILAGWATATEASGVGAAGAFLLAAFNRRLSLRALHGMLVATTLTNGMIFLILIGATAFSFVFRALGGDHAVIQLVEGAGLGPWGLLLLIMALVFVLGFFFDWIEISLIVLPIFAPIVRLLDFGSHVAGPEIMYWFALLLAVNLQTSFLTPPFGGTLFYLRGVAPSSVALAQIYRGIIPFVILQLLGLAALLAWPDLALWLARDSY